MSRCSGFEIFITGRRELLIGSSGRRESLIRIGGLELLCAWSPELAAGPPLAQKAKEKWMMMIEKSRLHINEDLLQVVSSMMGDLPQRDH